MIREAILEAMKRDGVGLGRLAARAGVDPGNLSRFLAGGQALGVGKVERVIEALSIEVRAPEPEWQQKVNRYFHVVCRRLPDIPQEDIHMILVSLFQPVEWKHFILKKLPGGGYAV